MTVVINLDLLTLCDTAVGCIPDKNSRNMTYPVCTGDLLMDLEKAHFLTSMNIYKNVTRQ